MADDETPTPAGSTPDEPATPPAEPPPPPPPAPPAEPAPPGPPPIEPPTGRTSEAGGNRRLLVVGGIVAVIALLVGILVVTRGGGDDEDTPLKAEKFGAKTTTTTDSDSSGNDNEDPPAVEDELPDDDIDLNEDVVVVRSDGGKAVESYGDDGKTIVIDGDADGADELAAGKIMLLTGVTVVRVASVEPDGDDLVIEGEPVTLPEVIDNGELSWSDVEVDGDDARVLQIASGGSAGTTQEEELPEEVENFTGEIGGGVVDLDAMGAQPIGFVRGGAAAKGKTITGTASGMKFALTYTPAGSGHNLNLVLTLADELSGTIEVDLKVQSLAHSGDASVVGGRVQNFDFEMADLGGEAVIQTNLKGLENVASLTTPPFFKLPFSIEFPALVGGVPFTLGLSSTIQVNLSMALANSSLSGKAEITFDGDAGFHFKGGSATLDGKRTQDSPDLLQFLKGAAPGPVGIVFTTEMPKISFGFGFLQTGAGIFVANGMVASQTILPQPAACTAMNVAYVLAAGVEAKFLGKEFEIARKAIVDKRWNYQVPQDQRCNAPR